MPVLNLAIGQSKYTVNCEKGEEEKVLNLAARLNERVNNLSLAMRGADEKTVLMLCALMAEEESDDAKNNHKSSEKPTAPQKLDDEKIKKIVEEKLIEQIESTVELVSKLAKKIDNL